jgi:hypothetical protein
VSLNGSNNNLISIANLDVADNLVANIFPTTGKWYDFFTGAVTEITDVNTRFALKAGEFHIYTSTPLPKPQDNLVPWKALDATVLATENEIADDIKVYPNPSNDFIYIEIPAFSKGTFALKINDLVGKLLFENELKAGQKTYSLDIQKLPKGTYFINAEQGEKRFVKKFVKL